MNVLLIQPRSRDARHQPYPPLGLLAVGTYLKAAGHRVRILDRNVAGEALPVAVRQFEPDIVGVTAFTGTMALDALAAARQARRAGVPVVWGGVHPSLMPAQVLESGAADYVAVGEGEETFVELLAALGAGRPATDIAGLALRADGALRINPGRPFLDLTTLPPTDWTLIDVAPYFQGFGHCARLLRTYTSKGCTGRCAFCYNQAFHRSTWRGRTPEQVVDEAELLAGHYGADGIGFVDELWSPDAGRLRRICELFLERRIAAHWYFNARVDQYAEDDLALMHAAGCRWILFGVESGSPRILKAVRKGIDLERVQRAFDACRRIGISTIASFMFGFPGETAEDLRLTARFALGLNATYFDFTRYMCYPGTALFDEVTRDGLFKPPATLEEWARVGSWDRVHVNFTRVSRRALTVFNDYFAWLNMRRLLSADQRHTRAGYLKKLLPGRGGGWAAAVKELFGTALEALGIITNLALHPGHRRRLGLGRGAAAAREGGECA